MVDLTTLITWQQTGLDADKGTPERIGQTYYATDTGFDYVATGIASSADWELRAEIPFVAATTPPFVGARATKATDTAATTTPTAISFLTEDYDTNTFHSTSSNQSRLTVPSGKDGYYEVSLSYFNHRRNSMQQHYIDIKKNGTTVYSWASDQNDNTGANGYGGNRISTVIQLVAADYVEAFLSCDSNTDAPLIKAGAGATATTFECRLLGT